MKRILMVSVGVFLTVWLISCSKITSNADLCASAGYYGDQLECQQSVSTGSCSSATFKSSSGNLICWKATTTSNQSGNNTGTGTNTNTGCVGQNPPWTLGAWSPATCTSSVTQRTRTVTCNYPCPCAQPQPSTTDSCTPNMYGNKHYESECISGGGTLEWLEGSRVCGFGAASCKSGWTAFTGGTQAYTITTAGTAQEDVSWWNDKTTTVTTLYHSTFAPRATESALYCSARDMWGGCKSYGTVYATVTRVACY